MSGGFEPTSWLRIVRPDGRLWVETSSEAEARRESKITGWPIQRLWQRITIVTEWRPDS